MLKNINDYLNLICILALVVEGLGIFVGIFIKNHDKEEKENFLKLFKEYIDNTEE